MTNQFYWEYGSGRDLLSLCRFSVCDGHEQVQEALRMDRTNKRLETVSKRREAKAANTFLATIMNTSAYHCQN